MIRATSVSGDAGCIYFFDSIFFFELSQDFVVLSGSRCYSLPESLTSKGRFESMILNGPHHTEKEREELSTVVLLFFFSLYIMRQITNHSHSNPPTRRRPSFFIFLRPCSCVCVYSFYTYSWLNRSWLNTANGSGGGGRWNVGGIYSTTVRIYERLTAQAASRHLCVDRFQTKQYLAKRANLVSPFRLNIIVFFFSLKKNKTIFVGSLKRKKMESNMDEV